MYIVGISCVAFFYCSNTMTQYAAIIFDFDGVILDSEPIHCQASQNIFKTLDIHFTYQEYLQKYIGLSDAQAFHEILRASNRTISADAISQLINQKSEEYLSLIHRANTLPLITGVEKFLQKIIAHNNKIAIYSACRKVELHAVLRKLAHSKPFTQFHPIITAEDVRFSKPAPEGYILAASKLQTEPQHCLVIEDSPCGIRAAKEAGMHVFALTTTHEAAQLQKADKIFSGFSSLMAALCARDSETKFW